MQHASVGKLFKEQVQRYSHKDQYKNSSLKPLIFEWLKGKKTNKKLEICEFGGGAGQLLGELKKVYPHCKYSNVEIINDYKKFLVSKEINFIVGSVLNSQFPDNSFDVIIMRDVLHHLVGSSYQETLNNQNRALMELKRLLRPQGAVFIEELTNESLVAGRTIYYLANLISRLNINISLLGVSSKAVVFFLQSSNLRALCYKIFGRENIAEIQIIPQQANWQTKLAHLGGGIRKAFIVIEKK